MGKKSRLAIILVLIVIMLLPTTAALAAQDKETKKDAVLASESVAAYIEGINATNDDDFSAWVGAHPVLEYTCFDLQRKVNAYVFTVENDQGIVGHVIIGGASYNFDVFKASTEDPPSTPDVDTVVSSMERDIESSEELEIAEEDIADPEYILFLGICELYAVYKIENQLIGINLEDQHAVLESDMTQYLPSPQEYKTKKAHTGKSIISTMAVTGSGSKILPLSGYYGDACGPNAGMAIIKYYRDEMGFIAIPPSPEYDDELYEALYDFMDTWPFEITVYVFGIPIYTYIAGHVTEPWNFAPGIVELMQTVGYSWFQGYYYSASGCSYNTVVYYIDHGWPGAVCCWMGGQPWKWHWYAVEGYKYDGSLHLIKTVKHGYYNFDSLPYSIHSWVFPHAW